MERGGEFAGCCTLEGCLPPIRTCTCLSRRSLRCWSGSANEALGLPASPAAAVYSPAAMRSGKGPGGLIGDGRVQHYSDDRGVF